MAGDILIIDSVATNRIVLKVKLLAAQYRVRPCASLSEAKQEIAMAPPDLIILDNGTGGASIQRFCKIMQSNPLTEIIPIIVTGGFATPKDRVTALEGGADDVLAKPFDDHILQARIRSLLRARDARQELRMREGTRNALGFKEAASGFSAPSQIVVTALGFDDRIDLWDLPKLLKNTQLTTASISDLVGRQNEQTHADLFVLDFRSGLPEDTVLYRLLSELRSQSGTRRAAILALLPPNARHAAAMGLDLGANDIICAEISIAEIRHRCAVLIRAKHEADVLRYTVENGLKAAITDTLTGLFNRRYALPYLARLSEESRLSGCEFAIMVLDIDHFKSINDTFGHKVGDEVLRQVARRLQDNLRAVDLLARIGGEEFLIAIPNSDVVHARTAAERLCHLIGDTPFFIGSHQEEIRVTMSVGVSLSDGHSNTTMNDDLSEIVNKADIALYQAKTGGRNKVSLSAA